MLNKKIAIITLAAVISNFSFATTNVLADEITKNVKIVAQTKNNQNLKTKKSNKSKNESKLSESKSNESNSERTFTLAQNGNISWKARNDLRMTYFGTDYQSTGIVARPGETFTVYVEADEGAPMPKIAFSQHEALYSNWVRWYDLKPGKNVITVPEIYDNSWIKWAMNNGIEQKVVEFISTFPEYLHKVNDGDINATPRSFERISKSYAVYKEKQDSIPKSVFLNVVKGNVGSVIAQEFVSFINSDVKPIISYNDVFSGEELSEKVIEQTKNENHTRLYISAMNILRCLESDIQNDKLNSLGFNYIARLVEFLKLYPVDLMIGIMKDIKNSYEDIYKIAIENEEFVDLYFQSYSLIRG